jgi:hypothetical protein
LQRARLAVLMAAVALTASLPLAGAIAGPVGEVAPDDVRHEAADTARPPAGPEPGVGGAVPEDGKPAEDRTGRVPGEAAQNGSKGQADGVGGGLLSGLGLTTAAQCGPELTSPEGVEAQTCVLAQAGDIWARTYYRNATGEELRSVLTLMGPGGRTVQMHCVVGAHDEPRACQTPREPARGETSEYSAIAEFAAPQRAQSDDEERPLLLRSGSNSARTSGS